MSDASLNRTPLFARHVELRARMVPFAGWEMPVYYQGINEEHRAVRARAGLFDVSHMGQIEFAGRRALPFLRSVLANDAATLSVGEAQYSLLTNDAGGIVDDLIVYRLEDERYLLVVNAGNHDVDVEHLRERKPRGLKLDDRSAETAMLALQGPLADEVLARVWDRRNPALDGIQSFAVVAAKVAGVDCLVARTGYTGERGVELMCAAADAVRLFDELLRAPEHGVVPCGLGARDTLRLEVCYPLHGNDITAETDPISAGLGRFCALDGDREFVGATAIRTVKAAGPTRRLVAFRMTERAIPRAGQAIRVDGKDVGVVTSGTLSPSLDIGIGMGYVPVAAAAAGTVVAIDVRGRERGAEIAKKPLYTKEH